MDELKDLYSHIENPIYNKSKWNKLLNLYSTSADFDDFYSKISKQPKTSKEYYDRDDKGTFYLIMWSEFKKQLLSLSLEQIKKYIINKKFDSTIYDVINQVKEFDSIKNIENLKKVLSNQTIYHYFSKLISEKSNNIVICSDFECINNKQNIVAFTVTVEAINLYKFLKMLYQKCLANEINYMLKYREDTHDVTIEIFVDFKNAKGIENILDILKKEYYSFFLENINNLLYGNINKWISIRSISDNYLYKRSQIIFKSVDSVLYEYVINHLNISISYKDGKMNLTEYIASNVMEKVITKILDSNIKTNNEFFSVVNSIDLIKLKDYVKSKLSFNMKDILNDKLYLKDNNAHVELVLNPNKTINIEANVFVQAIRNLIFALVLKDNALGKAFQIRIKNECLFHNLDPDKFCLDAQIYKQVKFDKNQYEEYRQQLDNIHNEILKLDNLEKLIEKKATQKERKEILNNMNELLEKFND